MDPTIRALEISQITIFKGDALSLVVQILPIGIGVMITILLLKYGIDFFLSIAFGTRNKPDYDNDPKYMRPHEVEQGVIDAW